ncbi:hypothetical protein CPLU01_14518 [Colletotrichum plurivorum]|uniref:Ankyrin repeat protein n=1 Tax=Colletotrichum plurivorum TaxID=2175906 RepID=A0A8H6MZJ2_9PEZI|nr:hypothetical protein CPLU01_14518 [Colletotrichum plurivorum]
MAEPAKYDSDDDTEATSPPPEGFDPDASREFLDLFLWRNTTDMSRAAYHIEGLPNNVEFESLLRWITEPVTRNAAFHVAAAAGNVTPFGSIINYAGRGLENNPWLETGLRAPLFQRNKAGDTVFHVAARAGHLDVVITAWRFFLLVRDSDVPPYPSGSDVDIPFYEDGFDSEEHIEPRWIPDYMAGIVLLSRKNNAGRTAADEANFFGHGEVAQWLSLVLGRLTLSGRKSTRGRMAAMEELVDSRYDIDGRHLTPDQFPPMKRYWSSMDSQGNVTWGEC